MYPDTKRKSLAEYDQIKSSHECNINRLIIEWMCETLRNDSCRCVFAVYTLHRQSHRSASVTLALTKHKLSFLRQQTKRSWERHTHTTHAGIRRIPARLRSTCGCWDCESEMRAQQPPARKPTLEFLAWDHSFDSLMEAICQFYKIVITISVCNLGLWSVYQ